MTDGVDAGSLVLAARALLSGKRDVLTLAHRPGSPVVHLYVGPLAPSGRYAAARGRTVCHARTRRLSVLPRHGVTVDMDGRRMCDRCSSRLTALSLRSAPLPNATDQRKVFWENSGVTATDLVVALAIATTVEDTHAIANVTNALFGRVNIATTRRPAVAGRLQGRWDFEQLLLARRTQLRQAERSPEEAEAAAYAREAQLHNDRLIVAGRRKAARLDRLTERRLAGSYLTSGERAEIGMTG